MNHKLALLSIEKKSYVQWPASVAKRVIGKQDKFCNNVDVASVVIPLVRKVFHRPVLLLSCMNV